MTTDALTRLAAAGRRHLANIQARLRAAEECGVPGCNEPATERVDLGDGAERWACQRHADALREPEDSVRCPRADEPAVPWCQAPGCHRLAVVVFGTVAACREHVSLLTDRLDESRTPTPPPPKRRAADSSTRRPRRPLGWRSGGGRPVVIDPPPAPPAPSMRQRLQALGVAYYVRTARERLERDR